MQLTGTLSYLLYAASVVSAAPFAKRAYTSGNTANDVTNGVCAPVTFIFARGSTENGNMGATVGPALAKALIKKYGASGVAVQGVTYTASIASNVYMGSKGGPVMAKLAQTALAACPDTKIILSGYSQGASVVHYTVKSAGLSASDVTAAVVYGDPENGKTIGSLPASQTKKFCAAGDGVCETGTFLITAAHLEYTTNGDIAAGASFVESAVGSTSATTASSGTDTTGSTTGTAATTTTSASKLSSLLSGGLKDRSIASELGSLKGAGSSSNSTSTGTSSGLSGLGSTGTSSGLKGFESELSALKGSGSTTGTTGTTGTTSTGSGLKGLESELAKLKGSASTSTAATKKERSLAPELVSFEATGTNSTSPATSTGSGGIKGIESELKGIEAEIKGIESKVAEVKAIASKVAKIEAEVAKLKGSMSSSSTGTATTPMATA